MTCFEHALAEVENSVGAGYNSVKRRWFPHASLEGGTPTIAYGHKMTKAETKAGTIEVDGEEVDVVLDGLSDTQAIQLLRQDIAKAEGRLISRITDYQSFPLRYKQVLISLEFNTGNVSNKTWPSLLRGMRFQDDIQVRQEMITSYREPSGRRHRLTRRAQVIADAVGLRP